jgi:hypothetical protein
MPFFSRKGAKEIPKKIITTEDTEKEKNLSKTSYSYGENDKGVQEENPFVTPGRESYRYVKLKPVFKTSSQCLV